MASDFHLSVVSPDKTVVDEQATSVVAPGEQGYFGVLANHEPFVAQLKVGIVTFKDAGGKEQNVAISGGFLEASGSKVIVLADSAETERDVDKSRAQAALDRAKKRLEQSAGDINHARAVASMERASNRLKLLG